MLSALEILANVIKGDCTCYIHGFNGFKSKSFWSNTALHCLRVLKRLRIVPWLMAHQANICIFAWSRGVKIRKRLIFAATGKGAGLGVTSGRQVAVL